MSKKGELLEKLSTTKLKKLAREKDLDKESPLFYLGTEREYLIDELRGSRKVKISDIESYLNVKRKGKKEVKIEKKKSPALTASQTRKLERKAGFKCEMCGRKLTLTPDIHHIKPRAKGGSNRESNLIVLCPNCHRMVHEGQISQSKLRQEVSKRRKTKKSP